MGILGDTARGTQPHGHDHWHTARLSTSPALLACTNPCIHARLSYSFEYCSPPFCVLLHSENSEISTTCCSKQQGSSVSKGGITSLGSSQQVVSTAHSSLKVWWELTCTAQSAQVSVEMRAKSSSAGPADLTHNSLELQRAPPSATAALILAKRLGVSNSAKWQNCTVHPLDGV